MLLRLRLVISFFDGIVNANMVKSEIKYNIVYVLKDTSALKLNVKSPK